jgi:hypothetical protein
MEDPVISFLETTSVQVDKSLQNYIEQFLNLYNQK